jgi:protein-S-isoprenylcysteine O-methyltransferase Ste14
MKKLVAWLGGALFVGSLASLAWWYFWWLGRHVAGEGLRAFPADAVLLTMFAGHHSVFARESVKQRLTFIPRTMLPSAYVWVASLLLMAVLVFWVPIGGDIYHVDGLAAVPFVLAQLAGLWLTARAVGGLDPLELAGIRQVIGWRGRSRAQNLQVTGPYQLVRHPIYFGWVLMFFGVAHLTVDRLVFAAMTTAYLMVAVPWEERSLRQSFGDDYARYAARVRWRIVPYLY